MRPHPQVRWVQWQPIAGGIAVRCDVCGAAGSVPSPQAADAFAAQHAAHQSAARGHYGLGDMVARATSALGATPCKPCEQRRHDWNQRFPRVWRR